MRNILEIWQEACSGGGRPPLVLKNGIQDFKILVLLLGSLELRVLSQAFIGIFTRVPVVAMRVSALNHAKAHADYV